jgi:hypothetical protein
MTQPEKSATAELPTFEMQIERGKIREFALAAQADPATYAAPDAVVPPTFLITAAQWAPEQARADVGFDRRRLLHGEQEFRFFGTPPRAGQTLLASERIADRYEKSGGRGGVMRFAVVVTEFRDEDGRVVAEARRTLIERAARAQDAQ